MEKGSGDGKGNGKRRIWEFQSYTISRILGLSFDERELRRLVKDLKLEYGNSALPEMYQHLAQICRTPSSIAKRVEKILDKQFAPHKKELAALGTQKICAFFERENGTEVVFKNVPIAALVWFTARNGGVTRNEGEKDTKSGELEAKISTALQLQEHQALRFYDELIHNLPESIGKASDLIKALNDASDSNVKLQRRCERLEQKKEELILERETIKGDKVRLVHDLDEQKRLNGQLARRVDELGGETAFEEVNAMKSEIELFRDEIKRLNRENADLMKIYTSESDSMQRGGMNIGMEPKFACPACNCKEDPSEMKTQLKDVSVAYVGGVESLETSYTELAKSFGCPFCYHGGHCERGKREIEGIVERNDVIFCPVDINSHNACRMVKEACKLRDKPCYFLRSSGLTALKKTLLNLAAEC